MEHTREILDVDDFVTSFTLFEELRDRSILITGANGLIGRTLVRCLKKLNEKQSLNLMLFTPRYTELEVWMASNTVSIDYIIHLACPTGSREMVEHPVEVCNAIVQPTQHLLDFARKQGSVMVYASSMEVYGSVLTDEEITEEFQGYVNPLSARSSYPMGKRMAETLCYCYAQEYGVDVKIARLVQTFGAGISEDDQRVFAQFARRVVAGEDIVLNSPGRTSRKYLYLTDAVSALLYILMRGERGMAYNAAHPDSYISILDMAKMLKKDFNQNINVRVELLDSTPYGPETHLNVSTARLEALGWQARVGLREMYVRLIGSLRNGL